jgi:hypothetical protein
VEEELTIEGLDVLEVVDVEEEDATGSVLTGDSGLLLLLLVEDEA